MRSKSPVFYVNQTNRVPQKSVAIPNIKLNFFQNQRLKNKFKKMKVENSTLLRHEVRFHNLFSQEQIVIDRLKQKENCE
jgi:hypothetical protein